VEYTLAACPIFRDHLSGTVSKARRSGYHIRETGSGILGHAMGIRGFIDVSGRHLDAVENPERWLTT